MNDDKAKGHCRVCDGEYTLTKNGRIRSHGGCDGGSDLPKEAGEVPRTASGGPNPHRAPLAPDARPTTPPRVIDPTCDQCNYDTHRCPGCGDDVPHGTVVCADCEVFHGLDQSDADLGAHCCDDCCGLCEDGECCLGSDPQPTPDEGHWAARAKQLVREGVSPFDAAAILDREMELAGAIEADAAGFLGTDAPSDEDLAADFFTAEEVEQAPSKGRWFPSKYDGECDVCSAHFERGEEIRGTEDGWQGRECCGQAEDDGEERPQAPRPRRVSPKPPMRRGRYKLPLPSTGKPTAFSRVTTFVKLASDHFGLKQWEMRSALVGLSRQPDILDQVAGLDVKLDRDRLNALAEMAKDAAGAKDKASTGTKMHKWTEEVDSARLTLDQVPEEFRTDVRRYREALEASGYRVVPHLIERTTVVEELGVVGTFDQLWQAPDGRYVVVDKKTGELTYGQMEIAAQLAIYAHGVNRHGVAEWDEALGDAADEKAWVWRTPRDEDGSAITVDESVGIVVHMPQDGRGITLYEVDLTTGWAHAQLCGQVRAHQKVKSTMAPIPLPDRDLTPAPTAAANLLARVVPTDSEPPAPVAEEVPERPLTWAERFASVTSKEAAFELLKQARDAGMPKARQDELVLVARAALAA